MMRVEFRPSIFAIRTERPAELAFKEVRRFGRNSFMPQGSSANCLFNLTKFIGHGWKWLDTAGLDAGGEAGIRT